MFHVPAILATLSTVISTVASALSSASMAVKALLAKLPALMDKIGPIAETLLDINKNLDQFSGVKSAEELGDKTIQAQEQDPELTRDPSDFAVDSKKTVLTTSDDKHTAALLILTASLEKEYGTGVERLAGLIHRNPDFFNGERLGHYLKACDGEMTLNTICDYFSANLDRQESGVVEEALMKIEMELQASNDENVLMQSIKQERE